MLGTVRSQASLLGPSVWEGLEEAARLSPGCRWPLQLKGACLCGEVGRVGVRAAELPGARKGCCWEPRRSGPETGSCSVSRRSLNKGWTGESPAPAPSPLSAMWGPKR